MRAFRLLPLLLFAGCSTAYGHLGPPTPTSRNPVTVTLHRVESISAVPLVFTIDGTEIYGLRNGETYRIKLDPGNTSSGGFSTPATRMCGSAPGGTSI